MTNQTRNDTIRPRTVNRHNVYEETGSIYLKKIQPSIHPPIHSPIHPSKLSSIHPSIHHHISTYGHFRLSAQPNPPLSIFWSHYMTFVTWMNKNTLCVYGYAAHRVCVSPSVDTVDTVMNPVNSIRPRLLLPAWSGNISVNNWLIEG